MKCYICKEYEAIHKCQRVEFIQICHVCNIPWGVAAFREAGRLAEQCGVDGQLFLNVECVALKDNSDACEASDLYILPDSQVLTLLFEEDECVFGPEPIEIFSRLNEQIAIMKLLLS